MLVFVVSTALAWIQPVHPDAEGKSGGLLRWWLWPRERNALLRLPVIDRPLFGLVQRGDREVWAAGEGGLVLYSADAGVSWSDWSIPRDVLLQTKPAASNESAPAPAALPNPAPAAPPPSGKEEFEPASKKASMSRRGEPAIMLASYAPPSDDPKREQNTKADGIPNMPRVSGPSFYIADDTVWLDVPNVGKFKRPIDQASPESWTLDSRVITPVYEPATSVALGEVTIRLREKTANQGGLFRDTGGDSAACVRGKSGSLFVARSYGGEVRPPSVGRPWVIFDPALNTWLGTNDNGRTWGWAAASFEASTQSLVPVPDSFWAAGATPVKGAWLISPTTAVAPDPVRFMRRTTDGGLTWTSDTLPYKRSLPPWYFVVQGLVVLPLACLSFVRGRREVPEAEPATDRAGIDALGTSDAPLTHRDRDVLNLRGRARALAEFLRNPKTEAPLTIAIEGRWGTGKSSLMNLLRHEMGRAGFGVVWFNAWHHQTEASLLAALLAHIRKSGRPSLLDLRDYNGPKFYYRLFIKRLPDRLMANPFKALLLALVLGGSLWLVTRPVKKEPPQTHQGLAQGLAALGDALTGDYDEPEDPPDHTLTPAEIEERKKAEKERAHRDELTAKALDTLAQTFRGKADSGGSKGDDSWFAGLWSAFETKGAIGLGVLGIIGSVVVPVVRNMRAFGVDPANLLKSLADSEEASNADLNLRARFTREFREFAEAFGERPLVIFIDDLDRCDKESVVEVLQAMNYLVTAGPCIIVAAFDPQYVRACVRMRYSELVTSLDEVRRFDQDREAREARAVVLEPKRIRASGENVSRSTVPSGEQLNGERGGAAQPGANASEASRDAADEFAREFLQKLVQIEEQVPPLSSDQTAELLTLSADAPEIADDPEPRIVRMVRDIRVRAVASIVILAAVGVCGYGVISLLGSSRSAGPASVAAAVAADPGSGSGATPSPSGEFVYRTPVYSAAADLAPSAWAALLALPGLALVALAAAPLLVARIPLPPQIPDTKEFSEALREWAPILHLVGRTPRAIKRLINRVRLQAAKQRTMVAESDRLDETSLVRLAFMDEAGIPVRLESDPFRRTHEGIDRFVAEHGADAPVWLRDRDQRAARLNTALAKAQIYRQLLGKL